jgi:hypothetical protein
MSKLLGGVTHPEKGTASIPQLARCIFWGFFGVRKRKDADHDVATTSLGQLVVAGLIGTVMLHLAVFAIVQVIVDPQDLDKREISELRELATMQAPKLDPVNY